MAGDPAAPAIPAAPAVDPRFPGDATQGAALRRAISIGLTGLGIGAGVRSLVGLKDMFADTASRRKAPLKPAVVEVNVPEAVADSEEETPILRRKLAADPIPTAGEVAGNIALAPFRWAGRKLFGEGDQPGAPTTGDLLQGRLNTEATGKPWWLPLAIGLGAGGLYGGYKAVDGTLNYLHKRDRENELEQAKEEYRKALVEQYSPEGVKTGAANDSLGANLSKLYALCKAANVPTTVAPVAGPALGGYLALASALAAGTGLATYSWAKNRSPDARLAEAIKQRERLRWATRPPEIYAVAKPAPVKVTSQEFEPGDQEDEELVRKYASQVAAMYKP